MKIRAMHVLTGAVALLLSGAAPLAAHGEHPEAADGALLHLLLHLPGSPWAWAAGAAGVALAALAGPAATAARQRVGRPER